MYVTIRSETVLQLAFQSCFITIIKSISEVAHELLVVIVNIWWHHISLFFCKKFRRLGAYKLQDFSDVIAELFEKIQDVDQHPVFF